MQAGSSNGAASAAEHVIDGGSDEERDRAPDVYRSNPIKTDCDTASRAAQGCSPNGSSQPVTEEQREEAEAEAEAGGVLLPGRGIHVHEFEGFDSLSPLEPDPDLIENVLEVDDDLDDDASIYAASQYPAVPLRYQVERFDSATM